MADDDRAGTNESAPDAEVAGWLEVEPLDDVARRRLVTTALHAADTPDVLDVPDTAAPVRPSRAWRWIAAAAAVVVVLVGGLAVLTASGGHDKSQATRERTALSPKALDQALADAPAVGNFGNLDDSTNLAALRAALERPSAGTSVEPATPAAGRQGAASTPRFSGDGCARGATGTVLAQGTGTLDGRPVIVVLLQGADGTRSFQALFQDACEGRDVSGPTP